MRSTKCPCASLRGVLSKFDEFDKKLEQLLCARGSFG